MTQPNPAESDDATSENPASDAGSPISESRPASPESRRPALPGAAPSEGRFVPVADRKLFRPHAPDVTALKPKPSAAPAPRLRPTAPPAAANDIGPAAESASSGDAADEIAQMFSGGEVSLISSGFGGGAATSPGNKPRQRDDPLFIRKTLIPILLTFGVVLAGGGVLLLCGGQDNALADLFPGWTPIALFVLAAIFLILAGLNMLSIKLRHS
jgi:hypothetical protein